MSYLTIDDYVIPVAEKSQPRIERRELGKRSIGAQGNPKKRVRQWMYIWEMTTPPLVEEKARALRNYLLGKGHIFHFNGNGRATSSLRPLQNEWGVTGTYDIGNGNTGDALKVASGLTFNIDANLDNRWYIQGRISFDGGSTWAEYAEDDAGNQWKDGASTTFTNHWFSVSSGQAQFIGKNAAGSNAANHWDEIIILPWRPYSDMPTAWTGRTTLFSSLPVLSTGGDFGSYSVRAKLGANSYEQFTTAQRLNVDFTLYMTRGD